MSSKSTIFLTNDNEHCYSDCNQRTDLGDVITVEFDKKNINIIANDETDLIIEISPGSELYEIFAAIRRVDVLAKFR